MFTAFLALGAAYGQCSIYLSKDMQDSAHPLNFRRPLDFACDTGYLAGHQLKRNCYFMKSLDCNFYGILFHRQF